MRAAAIRDANILRSASLVRFPAEVACPPEASVGTQSGDSGLGHRRCNCERKDLQPPSSTGSPPACAKATLSALSSPAEEVNPARRPTFAVAFIAGLTRTGCLGIGLVGFTIPANAPEKKNMHD